MRKKLLIELGLVLVCIAAGVGVFFAVVPKTTVNLAPLSRLSITNPKIPHITATATYSAPTTPQSSGLSVLEQAYASEPGETGAYTAQWFGLGNLGGNVGLFVELLPTKALARIASSRIRLKRARLTPACTFSGTGLAIALHTGMPTMKPSATKR